MRSRLIAGSLGHGTCFRARFSGSVWPSSQGEIMRAFSSRSAIAITAAGLVLSAVPAFSAVRGEFERTLQVNGHVDLQVETGSGSIEVHRGGSNQVHVVGHISANDWF